MNLIEALEVLKRPAPEEGARFRVFLACGFTPLHLQTFLAGHLQTELRQPVEVNTGLYGDLAGNIERLEGWLGDALAVVIEWQDLDSRLGVRNLGGWRAEQLPDILRSVRMALARLEQGLRHASTFYPICICLPSLPLPPLFTTATHQASSDELELRSLVASFAAAISKQPFVRVVSSQRLEECSAANARFDLKSEIKTGFTYRLSHASAIAKLLADGIRNPRPKKGLITDLDHTLWAGILGEAGVQGISWHLDQNAHIHGLYQQFLASLASAGVLIGVATKNDPILVQQAFERHDLVLARDNIFPIEAHWTRKSESIGRILKTWNIGADAVVFIDDSPMEIAEVKAAFGEMECLTFRNNDYAAFWELLHRLRDLFGKGDVSKEDLLRLQSVRQAAVFRESSNGNGNGHGRSLDEFLREADASMYLSFDKQLCDARALELINKTNQFNLNGRRLSESGWVACLNDPSSFVATVSYKDKYGDLGRIAVLLGNARGKMIQVDSWAMSCRAFSRRIEHQCLKQLFERFDTEEIHFAFQRTPRNVPLQEFFSELLGAPPAGTACVSRQRFLENCPSLFHGLKEDVYA